MSYIWHKPVAHILSVCSIICIDKSLPIHWGRWMPRGWRRFSSPFCWHASCSLQTVVRSHPITRLVLLRKIVMRWSVAIACRRRGLRRGGTGWWSPASAGRREDGREQRDTRHIVCEDSVHRSHQDLLLLHVAPWWWFAVLQWSERVQAPVSQAGALEKASERQFVRSCHDWVVG